MEKGQSLGQIKDYVCCSLSFHDYTLKLTNNYRSVGEQEELIIRSDLDRN